MKNILVFDLETLKDGKALISSGYLFFTINSSYQNFTDLNSFISQIDSSFKYQRKLKPREIDELLFKIQEADIIIGHNIIDFDLPFLKERFPVINDNLLDEKTIIDTLYLSPITFSKNPYHNLYKESYKPYPLYKNDPLQDSLLSLNLLKDELEEFLKFPKNTRNILLNLLQHFPKTEKCCKLISLLFNESFESIETEQLAYSIALSFEKELCITHLPEIITDKEKVVENYYALAVIISWIAFKDPHSSIGRWPKEVSPIVEVLKKLREERCINSECFYCKNFNIEEKLENYFDFKSFRPNQREVVYKALDYENIITVLPTGGGKSLCYQLPALIDSDRTKSMTIVIEPLVSLMQDQVFILKNRHNIPSVEMLSGTLNIKERQEVFSKVKLGEIDILFISPEQLRNRSTVDLLKSRTIARWVIDEAHSISMWGHDFRVDYTYLPKAIFKLTKNKAPIMCLTATAKSEVIEEIKNSFKDCISQPFLEFIPEEERKNLSYIIEELDEKEKKPKILSFLNHSNLPSVIYVSTRAKAEEYANFLIENGISADFYHAGLESQERIERQQRFNKDEIRVMVATTAFGMGIDKPNIRSIVVLDLPDSLESYIQEIGRAGRDGNPAKTIMVYNEDDVGLRYNMILQTKISRLDLVQTFSSLRRRAIEEETEILHLTSGEIIQDPEFGGTFDLFDKGYDTKVKVAIHFLEKQNAVERDLNVSRSVPVTLLISEKEAIQKIHSNEHLSDSSKKIAEYIIKNISPDEESERGIINTDQAMIALGVDRHFIWDTLETLSNLKIIDYTIELVITLRKTKTNSIVDEVKELLEEITAFYQILSEKRDNETSTVTIKTNEILEDLENKISRKITDQRRIYEVLYGLYVLRVITFRKKRREVFEISFLQNEPSEGDKKKIFLLQEIWKYSQGIEKLIEYILALHKKSKDERSKNGKKLTLNLSDILKELQKEIPTDPDLLDKAVGFLSFFKFINILTIPGVFSPVMSLKVKTKVLPASIHGRDLSQLYKEKFFKIRVIEQYALGFLKKLFLFDQAKYIKDYFALTNEDFISTHLPALKEVAYKATTYGIYNRIEKDRESLTKEQKQIVDTKEDALIVLAGPGSGKTKLLVHKIASLIIDEGINPEEILALVFNRSAKLEIKKRLINLLGNTAKFISVHTFHSFAMSEVCHTNISEVFKSDKKDEKFKDIIINATEILKKYSEAENLYLPYKYILIDEYQDINKEQYEMVSALVGRLKEKDERLYIFAVGDDDQNIYEFGGSNIEFIKSFQKDYDAKIYYLTLNFRSNQNIVDFANKVITKNKGRLKSDIILKSSKQDIFSNTNSIFYEIPSSKKEEALTILSLVNQRKQEKIAILGRTNESLDYIKWLLKEQGVEFKSLGGRKKSYLPISLWVLKKLLEESPQKIFSSSALREALKDKTKVFGLDESFLKESETFFNYIYQEENLRPIKEIENNELLKELAFFSFAPQTESQKEIIKEKNQKSDVYIDTIHKSKGTEFDTVVITSSNHSSFNKNKEEEARLYYVALTRAKKQIIIFQAKNEQTMLQNVLKEMSVEKPAMKPLQIDDKKFPDTIKSLELDPSDIVLSFISIKPDEFFIPEKITKLTSKSKLELSCKQDAIYIELSGNAAIKLSKNGKEKVMQFSKDLSKISVDEFGIRVREAENETNFIVLPTLLKFE